MASKQKKIARENSAMSSKNESVTCQSADAASRKEVTVASKPDPEALNAVQTLRAARPKMRLIQSSELPASVRKRLLMDTTSFALADRIVAYVRESSEGQIETSAPRQIDNVDAYCARARFVVSEYYHDEGVTGTSIEERYEFQRMMADARAGKFKIIICEAIDRFSRNLADLFRAYEQLCKLGIELHDATVGRLSLAQIVIMGYMAEEGRRRFLELTRGGLKKALENGKIMSNAPYGFKKHPSKRGLLIKVPMRIKVVLKIFNLVAQGLGSTTIADHLNKEGYPSPLLCRRLDAGEAASVHQSAWDTQAVARIVRNEIYIGFYIYGKRWQKGKITSDSAKAVEPRIKEKSLLVEVPEYKCVDPEVWRTANEQLDGKALGPEAARERSGTGLLAGRIVCAVCGSPLHMRMEIQRDRLQVFRCSSHISSKVDRCTNDSAARVDCVEGAVIGLIEESILDQRQIERYRLEVREALKQAGKDKQTDRANVTVRLEKIKQLLFASLDKSLLEGLSPESQIEYRLGLEREASRLKEQLEVIDRMVDDQALVADLETLRAGIAEMRRDLPFDTKPIENQVLVKHFRKLVKRVVIQPRDENDVIAINVEYGYCQSIAGLDVPSAGVRNMKLHIDMRAKRADEAQVRWEKRSFPTVEAATNHVYDLDDKTWSLVEDLLQGLDLVVNGVAHDSRRLINTLLCILKTGSSINLPNPVFGDPRTTLKLLYRLVKNRFWDAIVSRLQDQAPHVLQGVPERRLHIAGWQRHPLPSDKSHKLAPSNPTPAEVKKQIAELRKRASSETQRGTKKRLGMMVLFLQGATNEEVAATFDVSISYVYLVKKKYKDDGLNGLLHEVQPQNGSRQLTTEQIARLIAMAKIDKDPFDPSSRTSYKSLARWCQTQFAATYTELGLKHLLKRFGVQLGYMRNEKAVKAKLVSQANRKQANRRSAADPGKRIDKAA